MKKMKNVLLGALILLTINLSGQKNLAEVNKIKGFYVFVDCKPIGEYSSIGEVKVDENDFDVKKSRGQYQSVRDNLIKTAREVNLNADGIIITFIDGGTDKAEIIKFKESEKNKSKAKAEQVQGVYIYIDSTPISESTYIGTVKKGDGGGFTSAQYTAIRDGLIKKSKKEFKDKEFDALILKFVQGGSNTADVFKLK